MGGGGLGWLVRAGKPDPFHEGTTNGPNGVGVVRGLADHGDHLLGGERAVGTEKGGGLLLEGSYPSLWSVFQDLGATCIFQILT